MQQRTATLTVNGHQFIVVVSAQWGAGLTNPSESPTQEMLLVTGEKRAGEGESSASAQTLPFFSVLPGHIVQGARPGQDKREPVQILSEGVWSVCYPKTLSCFGERVAEDWGAGEEGGGCQCDGWVAVCWRFCGWR